MKTDKFITTLDLLREVKRLISVQSENVLRVKTDWADHLDMLQQFIFSFEKNIIDGKLFRNT